MNARHIFKIAGLPKSTKRELVRQLQANNNLTNELKADHNGLATKMDSDAGITDTNYNALWGTTSPDISLT